MPIRVKGPDGQIHSFEDGTPDDAIDAQMSSAYGFNSPGSLADAPPVAQPLAGPGMMPPGTTPGRMVAQEDAPDASMVPLSANAGRAQRLMTVEGLLGDRAGVMSQNDILRADPTFEARQKQAGVMGTTAGQLDRKREAGTRVYSALNDLEQKARAWYEHAPGAFNGATGPWNSNQTLQMATGWSNRGAQAFNTTLHHDIEKLVALYREMPSTGAGSGSDAQDANFKDAMGQWITAPDPQTAFAILQSAKDLIRAKSGLPREFNIPHTPLDPRDVESINTYAEKPITPDSPYVTGGLKVGTVRKGYVYQGGSPADPASWQRAAGAQ